MDNNIPKEENNNTEELETDTKDQNFMAEMVEVRVKMYMCRICGIRYDNMESMKQHYNEDHPTTSAEDESMEEKITTIKEEIMEDEEETLGDEGETQTNYVIIGEDGQPLDLPMESIQVLQIADGGENGGQIVFRVINQDETDGVGDIEDHEEQQVNEMAIISEETAIVPVEMASIGEVIERRRTRQQQNDDNNQTDGTSSPPSATPTTPSKRGRKRKNAAQTPILEPKSLNTSASATTLASTRPKRMVVPNIKSEFVYEGISQSVETPITTTKQSRQSDQTSSYTFIREGGVITAFQVTNELETSTSKTIDNGTTEIDEADEATTLVGEDGDGNHSSSIMTTRVRNRNAVDDDEDYPADYTPTSKVKKGRQKHVCEWPGCNKRFLQQCHLKKHIMGHADIKPFACDWPNCNYKAVTMAYVTNHRGDGEVGGEGESTTDLIQQQDGDDNNTTAPTSNTENVQTINGNVDNNAHYIITEDTDDGQQLMIELKKEHFDDDDEEQIVDSNKKTTEPESTSTTETTTNNPKNSPATKTKTMTTTTTPTRMTTRSRGAAKTTTSSGNNNDCD
ncbi:hypothetical protein DERF_005161 [Dermatophagoides farinae]|uniref:C2H2-type domain-containing protein n=1 Tax=Dermatophagoides farinae TaxID=6954 RepID=A0A922I8T9_DERFA|nr:hypothetical protein DERF_005161 [Dermatophagoides farinae]